MKKILVAVAVACMASGLVGQSAIFSPQIAISTYADSAFDVYAADLDGDGDADVLSASALDDKIAWYENTDGRGNFGPQLLISSDANGANGVYAADLDGDGDLDVLSTSYSDDKIAWYENTDGLGNFGAQQIISTIANGPESLRAADIDGDGDIDVLSASALDDKIAWYENTDGLGSFGAQQIISINADRATDVDAADLDGDGDIDVLSASDFDDKIAWYENTDGLGNFGPQLVISSAFTIGAISVHSADVDGDGDFDVLSASYIDNKIAWYENTDGLGNFGAQQVISAAAMVAQDVFTADIDGDGDVDVLSASAGKIAWYENTDGLGNFGGQRVISTVPNSPKSVYAADLDGDGAVDVLLASALDDTIAWHASRLTSVMTLGAGCGTAIPLVLTSTTPYLGNSWTLTAYGPLSPSWLFFFGDTKLAPGIPIPGTLPGCLAFTNGNLYTEVQSSFGFTASMQIPIPNFAGLVGYSCAVQAFSTAPGGFITSNGIAATLSY